MILAVFAASLLTAVLGTLLLIPRLHRAGITGKDMHKLGKPEVAEMGGLAIVAGARGPGDELSAPVCRCFRDSPSSLLRRRLPKLWRRGIMGLVMLQERIG